MASEAETISDAIERTVKASENNIIQSLVNAILEIVAVRDGVILQDGSNTETINQLSRLVKDAFEKSGYNSDISNFVSDFDKVESEVILVHKELNNIDVSPNTISAVKREFVGTTIDSLAKSGVNQQFFIPIRKLLYININQGARLTEVETALRRTIKGRLNRWVGQVARDAVFGYEGQSHAAIKEKYGMNGYRYTGPLVTDSRGQCYKWVEMREMPDSIIKSEIAWAKNKNSSYTPKGGKSIRVSGMKPSTNASSFAQDRGGYNCRHRAIPIFIT
jgi:hypothetical protein